MNPKNNNGYAIVSMTNGDVYHIDRDTATRIMTLLNDSHTGFINFWDTKSGAEIMVNLANVSSVVRSQDNA